MCSSLILALEEGGNVLLFDPGPSAYLVLALIEA